jgi:hypothetical protein
MDVVLRQMMMCVRSVDISITEHLRQNVDCSHIQERPGRNQEQDPNPEHQPR